MGRVKKVDLYENGTIAIVEAVSPELGNRVQRVRVQLPGTSSELLSKFRQKNIDFAAHTNAEDGSAVFLNLLGNLAFPLLLVGGLFLLTRRNQGNGGGMPGGMGGPGGNNPMAFGKSKAKFQSSHFSSSTKVSTCITITFLPFSMTFSASSPAEGAPVPALMPKSFWGWTKKCQMNLTKLCRSTRPKS